MLVNNKYGFVSGGYLYDKLDRITQDFIERNNPQKKYWMTKKASATYNKQVCSLKDIKFSVVIDFKIRNHVYARGCVFDKNTNSCLVEVHFLFVGKDKIHCSNKK